MQIYEILKQEHAELKNQLIELINLKEDDDYRFILVQEISNLLIPHARAEEAVFYNSIRAVDADKSIVADAYKEHMEAESLLRVLQVKDKTNFDWRSSAKKLLDTLDHHIQEEEGKVFNEARNIFSDQEAESIGDAFKKLKPNFVGEGVIKNTVEMAINLLPPRLGNSLRGLDKQQNA